MKRLLLTVAVFLFASAAYAQLLPVPGEKNPDWLLVKTEAPHVQKGTRKVPRMAPMPNASRKMISSAGNHHSTWDDKRQLAYDWKSSGSSIAPDELLNVRELNTDVVYVYRRAQPKRAD